MHADFARALRDNPDDEVIRLVFADWLEEQGETARAEFVRACCAAKPLAHDEKWASRQHRVVSTWERCRPDYWRGLPRITESFDGGLVNFGTRTRSDFKRLGGVRWLLRALADGWVGCVELTAHYGDDFAVPDMQDAWAKQARGVPLAVTYFHGPSHANLSQLLDMPELYDLTIPAFCFDDGTDERIAAHAGLRKLTLRCGAGEDAVDRAFAAAARAPNLRRLTVIGFGPRPTLDDLLRATGNPALRQVWYDLSREAERTVIPAARAERPNLVFCRR